MFGSTKSLPQIDQRPFGLNQSRAMTNQQYRPVPLLYGQARLGLTFISDCFDILASPVTQSTGKQNTQVGTNYYASFAAVICNGPIDGIYDLFLNGEPVFASTATLQIILLTSAGSTSDLFMVATAQTRNPHGLSTGEVVIIFGADQPEYNGEFTITVVSATQFQYQMVPTDQSPATDREWGAITAQVRLSPVLRNGTNPDFANITIPDYGMMTIYWGTETQPQDSYLSTKSGVNHPNYYGTAYIVFHQLFFGFNQTNVPNVEVVVARYPNPDWAAGPTQLQNDANPAYIIGDLYQNPRCGLALPDAAIDIAGLQAASSGTLVFGLSNAITRASDLRSVLTQICETIDAIAILSSAWLPSVSLIRPALHLSSLPQVADSDLADLPTFTPADWTTCYTDTKIKFIDASMAFQDNVAEWRDIGTRNVVENPDVNLVDRSWITRADAAAAVAAVTGQAAAIPLQQGKAKLRFNATIFAQLSPGSAFTFNYSKRNTTGICFRVTSRTMPDPAKPEFDLEFQADRTYLYSVIEADGLAGEAEPEIDTGTGPTTVPTPISPPPTNTALRVVELPPGLCPGKPAVAALVARGSSAITSWAAWLELNYAWSGSPPASYNQVAAGSNFAFHGALVAEYPATTRCIDLVYGCTVQLDGADQTLEPITAFEALANTVLAFIDEEILSLAGWTLIGAGLYQLYFIRGRYGTLIQDHSSGTGIHLIPSAKLTVISHPIFYPDNEAVFLITLGSQGTADVDPNDITLAGTAWQIPAPAGLCVNGQFNNATFPGGTTPIVVSWVLPDPQGLVPDSAVAQISTELQFYVASTMIATISVPWPANSYSVIFKTLNGGVDANFTVTAQTLVYNGLDTVASPQPASLNVIL